MAIGTKQADPAIRGAEGLEPIEDLLAVVKYGGRGIHGKVGVGNDALLENRIGVRDRTGIFSVRIAGLAPKDLSVRLESRFGILSRSGIHCAPLMHRSLGTTAGGGTTRLSVGSFISVEDVRFACDALAQIAMEITDGISVTK